MKVPGIGDYVYVPTVASGPRRQGIAGGRVCVQFVRGHGSSRMVGFDLAQTRHTYNWDALSKHQRVLEATYGETLAQPDPDF